MSSSLMLQVVPVETRAATTPSLVRISATWRRRRRWTSTEKVRWNKRAASGLLLSCYNCTLHKCTLIQLIVVHTDSVVKTKGYPQKSKMLQGWGSDGNFTNHYDVIRRNSPTLGEVLKGVTDSVILWIDIFICNDFCLTGLMRTAVEKISRMDPKMYEQQVWQYQVGWVPCRIGYKILKYKRKHVEQIS